MNRINTTLEVSVAASGAASGRIRGENTRDYIGKHADRQDCNQAQLENAKIAVLLKNAAEKVIRRDIPHLFEAVEEAGEAS